MDNIEYKIKAELAASYRILALNKMDDLTYTHLSARVPGDDKYFIYPFGLLFEEVSISNLITVSLDGEILEGKEFQYNKTGYVLHGTIYKYRPDINAIFHAHSIAGVAVSAQKSGLLPISQFALHFYNSISYHEYDSLALDNDKQGIKLIKDLGKNKVMILKNHGTITCGSDVPEAMFYTHHLEQACKVQIAAGNNIDNLIIPDDKICAKANYDLMNFEAEIGRRDWEALLRKLKNLGIKIDL